MAGYLDGVDLFLKNPRAAKGTGEIYRRQRGKIPRRRLRPVQRKYKLNKSMATEPRMLSIVFDRIGRRSGDEREKIFKGLVDNSISAEAKTLRAAR